MSETKAPLTAADLCERLRRKYPAEAYAMLYEVRNGTGFQRSPRSADVLMMSLWPSRGLDLTGFEVKVSRSDWKRELADPGKADAIQRYCDRWYVLAPETVVPREELPSAWGLLVPYRDGLTCAVEAPKLEPVPIDRLFLASVMRSASSIAMTHPLIEKEVKRRVDDGLASERWKIEDTAQQLALLQERVQQFQTESGVDLEGWDLGNVALAVKVIKEGGLPAARRRLQQLFNQVDRLRTDLSASLSTMPESPA